MGVGGLSPDPLELAAGALARRDLSTAALEQRLRRAGADAAAAGAAVARLSSLGALDDARLATDRASRLAERGYGNAAIEAALAGLEPEAARARRIVATAPGRSPRVLAATLTRRGFARDSLEAVLGPLDGAGEAELG